MMLMNVCAASYPQVTRAPLQNAYFGGLGA